MEKKVDWSKLIAFNSIGCKCIYKALERSYRSHKKNGLVSNLINDILFFSCEWTQSNLISSIVGGDPLLYLARINNDNIID